MLLTLSIFRDSDVKKSFSAACREADITNFTFHDLCHTFGARLADAGVDVVKIRELMGHSSIVTTHALYLHQVAARISHPSLGENDHCGATRF